MRFSLGDVLRRSAVIALRHRVLWLYGCLLVLLGAECSHPNVLAFDLSDQQRLGLLERVQSVDASLLVTGVVLAVFAFMLLWAISVVVGNWAAGALLGGINLVVSEGTTSFGSSARLGWRYFGQMLVIGFLSGLMGLLLLVPLAAVLAVVMLTHEPVFLLALFLWLPVVLVGSVLLALLVALAQVHVVLACAGPLGAIVAAWRFLGRHWWELLLVWLVNEVAVGCATGCLLSSLVALAAIPALLSFFVNPALGAAFLVPVLLALLIATFVKGVIRVFQKAVWLLAYQGLETMPVESEAEPPPAPASSGS